MAEDVSKKPIPVSVEVEFCGVCDYGGHCLNLARRLKDTLPLVDVVCTRGRQGSFEVIINEVKVYSKLQTMALPDFDEVVSTVQNVSEGGPIIPIKTSQPINCVLS